MERRFGYTIVGPQVNADGSPVSASNSFSVRREPKSSGNDLRLLYQNPSSPSTHRTSLSSTENGVLSPATPVLPPTPPNADDEAHNHTEEPSPASDVVKARSMLATPVHQMSPPTPDDTPPREQPRLRPFLGAQSSMASSRADSFKTAREEIPSDKESLSSTTLSRPGDHRSTTALPHFSINVAHKPSPLAVMYPVGGDGMDEALLSVVSLSAAAPLSRDEASPVSGPPIHIQVPPVEHNSVKASNAVADRPRQIDDGFFAHVPQQVTIDRSRTLRERLEDSRQIPRSPSVDKFASIIGWNNNVQDLTEDNKRWSGVSTASTVEAYLVEQPRVQKKRNTLRHMSKNDSLRSVSSPLPKSDRASMQSVSDYQHRLVHKKARLTNRNRLSFGSEASWPLSVGSNPAPGIEVIRVAVIPERSSSLQRSMGSSRGPSGSGSAAPSSFRMPRSATDSQHRRRAMTDTSERGRSRHHPPQVPPRGSSMSAPVSRDASRANSLTSEHARFERKRAEKDLRSTLDKMELERLATSLHSLSIETSSAANLANNPRPKTPVQNPVTETDQAAGSVGPGSQEWASLRPLSGTLHTPFSQPSFMSASPEISEAKLIHVSVHNNHSIQLIEPMPVGESRAVQEARRQNHARHLGKAQHDSPLRNPRRPPTPPQFNVIPPTPLDEFPRQLGLQDLSDKKEVVPPRPPIRARTDSFAKTLLRNVSLKNARNKKADQELDSSLHPFWRPRAFWEDIEPGSPEKGSDTETEGRGLIKNSLGLPQERVVVTGPLGLVRRFSERRRNRKVVAKQSSYNSLQKLRTARKLYRVPGVGTPLQLMSLKDVREKVHVMRQKRREEKRERRRDELRRQIGPNVIPAGDSRFPAGETL